MWFTRKKTKVTDIAKEDLNQTEAKSLLEHYQTVEDLPMWNFRQILETGDIKYLYKLDNYTKLPEKDLDFKIWDNIFWDYIDKKGIDYNFKLRIELKAKLAILENEQVYKDKNNYTKIELTKQKLRDLQTNTKKNADLENDAILSKFMGFAMQPRKHTVSQYIGFEKLLIQSNKKDDSNNR